MAHQNASSHNAVDSVFRRMGGSFQSDRNDAGLGADSLFWFVVILGCITIGQRFAVPLDESQFGFGFLFCLLITASLALGGRLTIEPSRIILYVIGMSGCLLTLFFKRDAFSIISMMMLFVVYFSYIFSYRLPFEQYYKILSSYQNVMLFCVWCGLVQFLIQFPLSSDFMFPFDMIVPNSFFIPEFNLRIPITEDLPYEKSTGLWFLEPSHFSQFLAFAVIIELRYFNRPKRLMLYLGSMVLCFSGTGFILLALVGTILIIIQRRISLILLGMMGIASIFLFRDFFPFSIFYERLADFTNPLASGSGRFIAPYWVISDLLQEGRSHILIWGLGPGELRQLVENTDYFVQDSSWFKLSVEYGWVGLAFFMLFFLPSLFAKSPDKILSAACLVQFMLLGGYLLSFYVHFLYLVLVVWPVLHDDEVEWQEGSYEPIDDHQEAVGDDRIGSSPAPDPVHGAPLGSPEQASGEPHQTRQS
ncbi:MAG: hypothetical protein ACR2QF_15605 [Geminicoccaceae bacterium]